MKVAQVIQQLCEELSGDPKVFEYYESSLNRHGYKNLEDMNKITAAKLQQIDIPEDIAYIKIIYKLNNLS